MPRARGERESGGGLADPLAIRPAVGPMVRGGRAPCRLTYRPPGSKSLTNRAILLAALADGRSVEEARAQVRTMNSIEVIGSQRNTAIETMW